MEHKVKIYTNPRCPYCQSAKKFLQDHKVPYEDLDVASNAKNAQEMKEKTGSLSVPVLDINGEIIIGFDPDKINKALGV